MVANKLPKQWLLKCELLALLAVSHRCSGKYGALRQACAAGLDACQLGAKTADR